MYVIIKPNTHLATKSQNMGMVTSLRDVIRHFYPTTYYKSGNVFGRGVRSFVRSFPHTTAGI